MKTELLNEMTVAEIVTADFRTAEIFKKAGIDFCCGGKKNLVNACDEKTINPSDIIQKIKQLEEKGAAVSNFNDWDIGFLSDYIVNTHHRYIRKTLPDLAFYTEKIARVHGPNHPELTEVLRLFNQVNMELPAHLFTEETVLFPAIKRISMKNNLADKLIIQKEIERMLSEHDTAGSAMDQINRLTGMYRIPEDACNTYRVTLKLLEQFEDDLHTHVHLENNLLFPKALKI